MKPIIPFRFDFIATLTFRTAKEGGRRTLVFSDYRPQIKFDFEEQQTSGRQQFFNKTEVYPGETVIAGIQLLSAWFFHKKLENGIPFEFREGTQIMGKGIIIEIINDKLKKQ